MADGEHLRHETTNRRPHPAHNLRAHFERSGFVVESTGDGDLDVRRLDAPSAEQERLEIELHLKVWRAMHPGSRVELADE